MLFRILLGFTQRFGIDDVELNMMAIKIEVGPNQMSEFVDTIVTSQHLWTEFHI